MSEKISKFQYLLITAVLATVVLANFFVWQDLAVGLIFGILYLLFYSFIAGSLIVTPRGWQFIIGLLLITSIIAIIAGGAIYVSVFNNIMFAFILFLIPAILFVPYFHNIIKEKLKLREMLLQHLDKIMERKESKANLFLVFSYLFLVIIAFGLLFGSQTSQSIQSPFQVIPSIFFIVYFLTTALLITYALLARRIKLPLFLIIIHTFLSTSIALIIYKIGYGFDPFIHQAAQDIISQAGTITPKTPYYLGQYGIVSFLQKLLLTDTTTISRLLVPVLTSIALPVTIYFVFSHWIKKNYALGLSLSSLIIPFSWFIMTTPQNLANLFFLITILLSTLYYRGDIKIWPLYVLTLATLVIHPLAGIPLFIVVFLLGLFKKFYSTYQKNISLYFFTALIFTIFLPLAFIANGSKLLFKIPEINLSSFSIINIINKFNLNLDITYFLDFNRGWIATLVIIITLIYLARHKLLKNHASYVIAGLVIFVDFILVKYFLTFPELRSFDQASFVQRISLLAFYILVPIFLTGVYLITKSFWEKRDLISRLFIIFIISGLITSALYLSYPQVDQYNPAKFYSLSSSDIQAVQLIEHIAEPNHIVLANQMIGVASIKEFGFKKYYNNQFYYSMPNGTPRTFYDLYLDMIYNGATQETMLVAMNEAGVNEAYFVLNKYWRNAEKIAQLATQSSDEKFVIDDEIYIFKYIR